MGTATLKKSTKSFGVHAMAALLVAVSLAAPARASAAEAGGELPLAERVKPALKTLLNPHEQISDEGYIVTDSCVVCHGEVPDAKRSTSISNVKLRFEDDLNALCYRCHQVKVHPGAEGISVMMSGFAAPDHLVVPSSEVRRNSRLVLKDIYTTLPLDPKTGKILCVTCHNPHERGLLAGRLDTGADSSRLIRTPGVDICQICHRK